MKQNIFFENFVKSESVKGFLSTFKSLSEKGFAYEMVCNILTRFGFVEEFGIGCEHFEGNLNNGLQTLEEVKSLDYLTKSTTNYKKIKTGCSDITLKKDGVFYFCSVKYRDDMSMGLKDYDVNDIISVVTLLSPATKYEVVLFVMNKSLVIEKMKNAQSSQCLTKKIKFVIGLEEIESYFGQFKKHIHKNVDYDQYFFNRTKSFLRLRFHQELIIKKTLTCLRDGEKDVLWGCKPRSGKTYMAAGLIRELSVSVLITTNHPTEVRSQFMEMFEEYKDFEDWKFINIKKGEDLSMINGCNKNDKTIVFVSKQLLQTMDFKKLRDKFGLVVYDENHDGGTTSVCENLLRSLNCARVYLTGTPMKTIKKWNIPENCRLMWTLEDEKMCKKVMENIFSTDYFCQDKEGDDMIQNLIKNDLIEEEFKYYTKLPDLKFITVLYNMDLYRSLLKDVSDSVYGFSFTTLFSLTKDKAQFNFREEVKMFLRYISGSRREVDYKKGDQSIFKRIDGLLQKSGSRECKTQLWFLPPNNIDQISTNLKTLMKEDRILKEYEVLIVNSKQTISDVKLEIKKVEGKLIILAGSMLQLGVSIHSCDVVMLFNDTSSCDRLIQQSYRSMTESENKKVGIVVDLNPGRMISIINCITPSNLGVKQSLEYNYTYNLIGVDVDTYVQEEKPFEILDKLVEEWIRMPIHQYSSIFKRLDMELNEIEEDTQSLIYKYLNKINTDAVSKLIIDKKTDKGEEMKKGISREMIRFDDESDEELDVVDHEEEMKKYVIYFKKEILPYIIQLVSVLTIHTMHEDFLKLLRIIKMDNELLECFNEQSNVLWKQEDIIDVIIQISECIDLTTVNDICLSIKLKINGLIDNPAELLQLIHDCLKPKEIEKRQFGEVFTPLNFINENMLNDIEKYWMNVKKEDVWSNKELKWYDPAAGMGNYSIAIYYKLMNGLKTQIIDYELRKKHILENMLYMGELNKKNCYLMRKIFNVQNDYKLNLYEGDTLEIDIYKTFNVKKFDIIIGNPPYNEVLTKSGAKPLYHKFIEYYLDKCSVLSFIVPSRWFAGGKGLDKFREMMINRTDIVYIKHYDDACKIFGNLVDIKGGVNYFLIDENYNGLCDYNGANIKLNSFDVILDRKYYGIVNKLLDLKNKITDLYLGRYFGIESNDKNLCDNQKLVKCYVSQQKGFVKYIDNKFIKKEYNFYKVITTEGAFSANSGFGNSFIGNPNEVHTGSYISFKVKNENEANSLLSYMKCKLPNFMLSLRKISQHVNESTCKWIPLPPLDRIWTDKEIYKYFKLSDTDIKLIKETKIIGYKDLI